ncbi:hypothetical protein C482_11333 [Natrialba chahannaoensis JCM 10990]|uniref:Uncharacterized protein n=1 Tax=Natrialba chahannaoensis JCM 10990 TaxID=1227492 RepID=M0AKI5_9EURY|nr:hypothetical protein C482_11333 [Natrialba chahannaoensis JCM 10990]
MQVTVAFVVFQLRFEFGFVRYLTVFVPPTLDIVTSDVPQFGCCEPALVEVVTNLTVVRDTSDVCAGCLQHRTMFITWYVDLYIKAWARGISNRFIELEPVRWVVGFILRLKPQVFSLPIYN